MTEQPLQQVWVIADTSHDLNALTRSVARLGASAIVIDRNRPAASAAPRPAAILLALESQSEILHEIGRLRAACPGVPIVGLTAALIPSMTPGANNTTFTRVATHAQAQVILRQVLRPTGTIHQHRPYQSQSEACALPFRELLAAAERTRRMRHRDGQASAILTVDLDRFRECNLNHSIDAGNQVLLWAERTISSVAPGETEFAQQFSDRFVLLADSAGGADELAHRIRTSLHRDVPILPHDNVTVTATVGLASSTNGWTESVETLLERSRTALTVGKLHGGNCCRIWSHELEREYLRVSDRHTGERAPQWRTPSLDHRTRSAQVESTLTLVAAVEARDPYTRSHSQKVALLTELIGRKMGIRPRRLETLRAAALLHDIGKVALPDSILLKAGPLTPDEFDRVRSHPRIAVQMLRHVSFFENERKIILHHHERFDGKGYPAGLAGDAIPIGARILAVADTVDCVLSRRTYKEPHTLERAQSELRRGAGTQFDPIVVEHALEVLEEHTDEFAHPAGVA